MLNKTASLFNQYLEITSLFVYSIFSLFSYKGNKKALIDRVIQQIYFTGVKSVIIISFISLLIGVVVITITVGYKLPESLISDILSITIIQYLGPLLTMIIVIGRSGTAITIELGNMKVNNEIEALNIMGIDILYFIVAPRVIGITISFFCLNIFFSFIGVLGGGIVMVNILEEFSLIKFYTTFFDGLKINYVIDNIIKSVGFGIIISTVSCYHGLKVISSTTEVPQMTTQGVSRSLVFCFIFYIYTSYIFL